MNKYFIGSLEVPACVYKRVFDSGLPVPVAVTKYGTIDMITLSNGVTICGNRDIGYNAADGTEYYACIQEYYDSTVGTAAPTSDTLDSFLKEVDGIA
jgi:hypothetical protein